MNLINRIVPAILTDKPSALVLMARQAEYFAKWLQIDIMDGLFVPTRSIGATDIEDAALKVDWEAHLMVEDPQNKIQTFAQAGARRIIVHYETLGSNIDPVVSNIKRMGIGAGIAINPETSSRVLTDKLLSKLDVVLFMAVHPGFYGAEFISDVLHKIGAFKRLYPDISIGIDGGIKANNIAEVARIGVNEICVGSAIFKAENPSLAYKQLSDLAQTGWETNPKR